MAKPLFRGVCASPGLLSHPDGSLWLERLQPHIDWLIGEGVNAISPLGSSGEFPALECDDRRRVLEAAIQAVAGRVPVVAGTHDYSTAATIKLSRFAERCGADALLIVPPYYMAPTPIQVMDHYRRIAEQVSIPILVYHDIPLTSVDLTTDHLLQLFEERAIAGVKMSRAGAGSAVPAAAGSRGTICGLCGD
jgi:4-hydroxy-tetrahydrodipicolinate synthase